MVRKITFTPERKVLFEPGAASLQVITGFCNNSDPRLLVKIKFLIIHQTIKKRKRNSQKVLRP